MAHHPASVDLLRVCDRMGMYPSVILYCVGNEISEIGNDAGAWVNRRLVEKIREMDDSRIVTNAINGMTILMDKLDQVIPLIFTKEEMIERNIQLPITDINDALTILLDRTVFVSTESWICYIKCRICAYILRLKNIIIISDCDIDCCNRVE